MSRKKKGFTLVEVVVVIAISTIVLTMVGGSMIFITSTSANLMQQAEDIDMAKNIETYLRGLDISSVFEGVFTATSKVEFNAFDIDASGNFMNGEKTIFADTGLTYFQIKNVDGFIICSMEFDSGKQFEFIVGSVTNI